MSRVIKKKKKGNADEDSDEIPYDQMTDEQKRQYDVQQFMKGLNGQKKEHFRSMDNFIIPIVEGLDIDEESQSSKLDLIAQQEEEERLKKEEEEAAALKKKKFESDDDSDSDENSGDESNPEGEDDDDDEEGKKSKSKKKKKKNEEGEEENEPEVSEK